MTETQGVVEGQQHDDSSVSDQTNMNHESASEDNKNEQVINNVENKPSKSNDNEEEQSSLESKDSKESAEVAISNHIQQNESLKDEVLKENEKSSTATVKNSDKPPGLEGKGVQTLNLDPLLNKKIKKKDKSSAEEKKLGEKFSRMAQ